jgi:hypothetical protein
MNPAVSPPAPAVSTSAPVVNPHFESTYVEPPTSAGYLEPVGKPRQLKFLTNIMIGICAPNPAECRAGPDVGGYVTQRQLLDGKTGAMKHLMLSY